MGWRKIVGTKDFNRASVILLATEFFGTLAIVFTSILTMAQQYVDQEELQRAIDTTSSGASMEQISLGLGLVFAAVGQALGRRSVCHFNPAVTLGYCVVGELSLIMSFLFVVVQCTASALGVCMALVLLPEKLANKHLGVPKHPHVSVLGTIVIEMLLTFIWVFLARSAESHKMMGLRDTAPLAVGATIIAAYLAAYRLTGGCMNPARSFGPAVVYMDWKDHWIYWLAPFAGGVLGALTYEFLFKIAPHKEQEEAEENAD
ncbi:PREDICTED: aquaporin-like [Bactrocera latifrons]|uniref:Aquaporin n=1 Tax=Bactrocera latifrons TaxID=174628 RepID=A0A0K8VKY5_BACLA|nr:PREDICTED: aquaporin-like [Bactrocera latifrons]